jgi:hypothetical protein
MKNIVHYSAIILIISCQPKFNESKFFFEFEEEISFASNDMASTNPGMIQLVDTDSGEYVFLYNHIIKKIQITEFPSGRNVLNIPLEFDEEKRARRFTGATLIAKDTIGVTFYPPAIGLINFSGDLIQFEPLNKESYNVTHIGNGSYTPLIKERNEIFGAQPFLMNHHKMEKSDIQKQHLLYSFDLNSNSFRWHPIFYNENYWDHGKKLSYFAWARRENKIYISPYYDHEIQVYDIDSKKLSLKKEVKSKYINKFNMVNELPSNAEEAVLNTIRSDQYEIFLYDKYRDVFYRIFLPGYDPIELLSIENLSLLERSRPFTGVMVLDKDLNVLQEFVFEKYEVHSSDNFLVGKEGLYISTNNMNREDFTDEFYKYKILRINLNK